MLYNADVALFDPSIHPSSKLVNDCGVDYVTEPLFGQFVPFQLIGKILHAVVMVGDELLDFLDAETLILWNGEIFHFIG